jgi:hypothetical protein
MHGCYRSVLHADWLHAKVVQARLGVAVAQRLCVLRRAFVCAVTFVVLGCWARERDRYGFSGADLRRVGLGMRF